jgi:hypothetical protein
VFVWFHPYFTNITSSSISPVGFLLILVVLVPTVLMNKTNSNKEACELANHQQFPPFSFHVFIPIDFIPIDYEPMIA